MVMVSDLRDPNDDKGRSYKEVNADKSHKYKVGCLVELEHGARAFIAKQTRDCDMTPLYSLCFDVDDIEYINEALSGFSHGYDECNLRLINDDHVRENN